MTESLRSTWNSLKTPSQEGTLSASAVRGTNAWVFKDHQGALGLLLSGIRFPRSIPRLENISMIEVRQKDLHQSGSVTTLRNCMEIHLDPSCDADLLTSILDRMQETSPDGHYTAELLLEVIQEVIKLVKRPPRLPTKEEVIGAWGEMEILQRLISDARSPSTRRRILAGWEANGNGRDIIDLRFSHASGGTAIEVKTSTTSRTHHINGMGQVTVPDGHSYGLLASLRIRETDGTHGTTTEQLSHSLETLAIGSEEEVNDYLSLLVNKLELRGSGCLDDRFYFASTSTSLRLIDMSDVPKPILEEGVVEVEWTADVSQCEHMSDDEATRLFESISA